MPRSVSVAARSRCCILPSMLASRGGGAQRTSRRASSLQPQQQRRNRHHRQVVHGALLVACGDPAALLEPIDQSFGLIALAVDRAVERTALALVALVRNGEPYAMLPQPLPDMAAAVAFVPHESPRSLARTPSSSPPDLSLLQQGLEHCLVMSLATCHQQHERFATAVSSHMKLRAEPAAAAPQGLVSLTAPRSGGVLVSSHDGAVDEVDRPIQLPLAIREALQGLEDTWPDASVLPTIEATRDGVPRAILRRQVTPGSAGGQNPDDANNDASMWKAESSDAASVGEGEERVGAIVRR
jgi:hypothetical protein